MIHQDVFCALICTLILGSLSHQPNRISGVLDLDDSVVSLSSARGSIRPVGGGGDHPRADGPFSPLPGFLALRCN